VQDLLKKLIASINITVLYKLIYTSILLLVAWILKTIANHIVAQKVEDKNIGFRIKKILGYIITGIVILIIGSLWIENFSKIGTFLGLFAAGIAISLKDVFLNIAGWLFILIRRPFFIGDRIEIAGAAGDVIDIRLFQFSILEIRNWIDADQSTGRIIDIPNGLIFTNQQISFNKGFEYIWNEIKILVTFESNWEKAKSILTEIIDRENQMIKNETMVKLKEANKKYLIMYANLNPKVYTSIRDSGILLTIRYLCKPKKRRDTEHLVYEKILQAFAEHDDIEFAYPTYRIYQDPPDMSADTPSSTPLV
jgi:small-conductance mechanosensitive channel